MPTSVWIRLSSSCICRRSVRSSAPSGSSSSSTSGRFTTARASATRCCWPPDSWAGLRPGQVAQLDQLQRLGHRRPHVGGPAPAQPERDVLEDVQVREQRVALEHRVDRPPVRPGVGDVLLAEQHPPGGRPLQPGHHPQRGRLPAAGRAEQGEERAAGHLQADAVDGGERSEALGDPVQPEVPPGHQLPITFWNASENEVSSSGVSVRKVLALAWSAAVGKIHGLAASSGSIFSIACCAPSTGQM